jgi:adiponectin receptor
MRHDVGHSRVPSPPSSPRSLHTPFGVASRCIIIIAMKVAKASAHPQEHTSSHTLTYHWDQILPWQQDNHYIRSGYRPQSNSYLQSGYSLAYLHNETVNIYTHLIGAILTLVSSGALYHVLGSRYDTASREDVWVFCCLFLGALSCLGMSATFHTISNHSHEVARWGNQLDYAGIVFLIWGSFIPVLYYGFQDDPRLMQTYWGMVSRRVCRRRMTCSRGQITTLAACTATISLHPDFRTPARRPYRTFMFVLMGLSAVIPVLHGVRLYGVAHLRNSVGLDWVIAQGVLYILGAAIYAARVPEKWSPGTYDIWGSSHQIFHVLVVVAAAAHLVGVVKAFDYKHRLV